MSNSKSYSSEKTNRLIHETSPYLLQHARNPVDWYPWSDEAFEKSRRENKPIFLSIGYSTCHWCHVMEHESFESQDVADLLNDHFVAIKVDREERPDVDHIYMSAVQAMTGSGGWPLTVFLTPDLKPFFGGTYFPPYPKWGSPGLIQILESVQHSWVNDRDKINQSGERMLDFLQKKMDTDEKKYDLSEDLLAKTYQYFERQFDQDHGGFGSAPKFPTPHNLNFLLRYHHRTKNPKVFAMAKKTLDEMAKGGIYDHLGGGFHRYSTDHLWQIPHFEKMLYDQALLVSAYIEAYQIKSDPNYERVIRETLQYVVRDMTSPDGGFYSAEDADSLDPDEVMTMSVENIEDLEKKEGSFYLWRYDEIVDLLDQKDVEIFSAVYNVKPEGNAHSDPHGEFTGKNILFQTDSVSTVAQDMNLDEKTVLTSIQNSQKILFGHRSKRPRSFLDDKIMTDWNGLMIAAFAKAGAVLQEESYIQAAQKSADFILENLMLPNGQLQHLYRQGKASGQGGLEDYAFFIHGLLSLYEATFDAKYLVKAKFLTQTMRKLFEDKNKGGFYMSHDDADDLIIRPVESYDGAIPSGNSIAVMNLIRLYLLTYDEKIEQSIQKFFKRFSKDLTQASFAHTQMMIVYDLWLGSSYEIVLALKSRKEQQVFSNVLNEQYFPRKVIIGHFPSDRNSKDLYDVVPFAENQGLIEGESSVYVCQRGSCQKPLVGVEEFQLFWEKFTQENRGEKQ